MADWTAIASLATAGGTLVLAIATFGSVRSANRAARVAERALALGLRPVLFASRQQDPTQTIRWGDDHWADVPGGGAVVELADDVIYLAMSIRNVGSGIAVIHGWRVETDPEELGGDRPDVAGFRRQGRDLYVPAGDMSFWQAALRELDDPDRLGTIAAIEEKHLLAIDLLYGDHEGGQRMISRFSLTPYGDDGEWVGSVVRHWATDYQDPRDT